jgi:hypothetical protein
MICKVCSGEGIKSKGMDIDLGTTDGGCVPAEPHLSAAVAHGPQQDFRLTGIGQKDRLRARCDPTRCNIVDGDIVSPVSMAITYNLLIPTHGYYA